MKTATSTISLLLVAFYLMLISPGCKKDLGNYKYKPINELTFGSIDTLNGYTIDLGDTLHITPHINATLDNNGGGNYSYEWRLLRNPNVGEETVLSAEKDLSLFINYKPAVYSMSYNVTDKTTGVTFMTRFPVTVTTPLYEGWLVLNKVADTSRLDFLSYRNSDFVFHKDILGELHAGVPPLGAPVQVQFAYRLFDPNMRGIFLTTTTGSTILDMETFSYSPDRNLSSFMFGNPPAGFRADEFRYLRSDFTFFDGIAMYADGNLYFDNSGYYSYDVPINTNAATGARFKIAPYIAYTVQYTEYDAVVYDVDDKKFMSINPYDPYPSALDMPAAFNFPTGKDLIYMTDNGLLSGEGTDYGYAVLHDPGNSKFYMLRFPFNNLQPAAPDYYAEITATDFANAENYAMSPNLNYLFYSAGGKLYEYDLFSKSAKLMLDVGSQKINLLVFDKNRKTTNDWVNSLSVAYYDPSGQEGSNGTLVQFGVPPVNGNLIQQFKWTGLGQVKSISYRFRASY